MASQASAADGNEAAVLSAVEEYLSKGRALMSFWNRACATDSFASKFPLTSTFNRPDESFGFFDQVPYGNGVIPVMGNFQDMFYDRTRGPSHYAAGMTEWMHNQVREFILHYFMRVSSFRPPEAYVPSDLPVAPPPLEQLSWCTHTATQKVGFGFKQLFYKLSGSGQIGRFSEEDQNIIVDVRELGPKYEWIVLKVNIFDFRFIISLSGVDPQVAFPLTEESYLVMAPDFITNEENPRPGVLGRYGFGYAFIKNPTQGMVRYGPGQFDAAIESIVFRVTDKGDVHVAMYFVANRPREIASIDLNPVRWGLKLADLASFGMTSRFLGPVKDAIERLPLGIDFDPVYSYITAANLLSGGEASRQLCISREHLDVDFLVQHFVQHYQTAVGSLLTWRQIDNWLDEARLPGWVVKGRSS